MCVFNALSIFVYEKWYDHNQAQTRAHAHSSSQTIVQILWYRMGMYERARACVCVYDDIMLRIGWYFCQHLVLSQMHFVASRYLSWNCGTFCMHNISMNRFSCTNNKSVANDLCCFNKHTHTETCTALFVRRTWIRTFCNAQIIQRSYLDVVTAIYQQQNHQNKKELCINPSFVCQWA